MLSKKISTASLLITSLTVAACGGGGGGGSSDNSVTNTGTATVVDDSIFSSRVIAVDIRREDSKESLPVSGLPLEGTKVTVSGN